MLVGSRGLVIIGKCGRPYGVRGWLHIQSFTADPSNILNYRQWILITSQGKQKPVSLEDLRPHGNHFVAKIKGFDSPEAAKTICLFQIAMAKDDLPTLQEGQYYWEELTGLQALLPNGKALGVVDSLFETGANDVIAVTTPKGKELLVPYIDSVVLDINLKQGTITLDWDPLERLGNE
jgi:16S rRNA processing protein RimM